MLIKEKCYWTKAEMRNSIRSIIEVFSLSGMKHVYYLLNNRGVILLTHLKNEAKRPKKVFFFNTIFMFSFTENINRAKIISYRTYFFIKSKKTGNIYFFSFYYIYIWLLSHKSKNDWIRHVTLVRLVILYFIVINKNRFQSFINWQFELLKNVYIPNCTYVSFRHVFISITLSFFDLIIDSWRKSEVLNWSNIDRDHKLVFIVVYDKQTTK